MYTFTLYQRESANKTACFDSPVFPFLCASGHLIRMLFVEIPSSKAHVRRENYLPGLFTGVQERGVWGQSKDQ